MQIAKNPRDTPGPGSYRPPSDFGYLEIIKSPRTAQSPRNSLSGNNFFSKRINTQIDKSDYSRRNHSISIDQNRSMMSETEDAKSVNAGGNRRKKINNTIMF
jgi:hypothetical protein